MAKILNDISIWFHDKFKRCTFCHFRKAIWWYGPGYEQACEECVPRGCDCNKDPVDGDCDNIDPANWVEAIDEKGRKWPCCEWMLFIK